MSTHCARTAAICMLICFAFQAVPAHGQNAPTTIRKGKWDEAFSSLESDETWDKLRNEISRGKEYEKRIAASLIKYVAAKAPDRPWKGPERYADMEAALKVQIASTMLRMTPATLVKAVANRLKQGGDDELLTTTLIGAGALRVERDGPGLSYRFPAILEYMKNAETEPCELPQPLMVAMLETDHYAAIITLSRVQGQEGRGLRRCAAMVTHAQGRLYFEEGRDGLSNQGESDATQKCLKQLATHPDWFARAYLVAVLSESEQLKKMLGEGSVNRLLDDDNQYVRERARSLLEAGG